MNKMTKFYVHCEDADCCFTMVFDLCNYAKSISVQEICEIFVTELTKRYPECVNESKQYGLSKRTGKVLDGSIDISKIISKENHDLFLRKQNCSDVISTQTSSLNRDFMQLSVTKTTRKQDILSDGKTLEADGYCQQAALLYTTWLHANKQGDPEIYNQISQLYLQAGRPETAHIYVKHGLILYKDDIPLRITHVECLLALGQNQAALDTVPGYTKQLRAAGTASTEVKHTLQMLLCAAYDSLGQKDMAIVMVQGVLRDNSSHEKALLEFARLTFDLDSDHALQAVTVLLSALVKDKGNKTVKKYLTEICQKPTGLSCLQQASGDAWNSIPALILLANVFMEQGAVELALTLLERGIHLEPINPVALLTYIHLLEVLGQPVTAVDRVCTFCRCDCHAPVHKALAPHIHRVLQLVHKDHTLKDISSPDIQTLMLSENPPQTYSEDDLHILAIWFTLVKILYLQNMLNAVKSLCILLDPFHQVRPFHSTFIRNEAAYYGCISKLITKLTSDSNDSKHIPTNPVSSQPSMYIIGDSHCLTPAWHHLHHQGQLYHCHPILSTGTKIWHLRPNSHFFTKTNFNNAISAIPEGSSVIVVLGEIDCREALPRCVDKLRYDSIEDAVDHLIDIYISVLAEIQKTHDWTVYVHPVPPVLDVTRPTVMAFNRRLKKRLSVGPSCGIYWLDFVDSLLTEDQTRLQSQYDLDGTHLHPGYISFLQHSLDKLHAQLQH